MKRILLFATALIIGAQLKAQTVADFETILPASDTAWFGQPTDGDTVFTSGSFIFENNYNASWNSWSGWAYSNVTDNTTPGYDNQFGNVTGSGEGSAQFGMCYASDFSNNRIFLPGGNPLELNAVSITNSTYAYLSMLNGDVIGKQFGSPNDASGNPDGTNGEDWFLLTIYGLDSDSLRTNDSINFYLADFRFSDNSQDYIVDSWISVNLGSLGEVYGLDFALTSSDNGMFGMNTPAYFAIDNLIAVQVSIEEDKTIDFSVYPNPTQDLIQMTVVPNSTIQLYDISGKLIKTEVALNSKVNWDLSALENGIYFVKASINGETVTEKIIKQ